ncbi:invasion associated locus B family protein [Ruegeria sp. HKCCD6228]|uniref:Invasion associated locus B family protein n=1 Tax=Ruegeria atlantica TaxID=81569 RepID=A0ABX1W8C1_9RHOB|nr:MULTISPECIES: invasion associated locus B family protein [Ruegeria]NOC82400.1 invasion associated locus B family protein [Ruegeria sp. HKCCD6428]NOC90665.1 invasion associated locus B family protein [Ruegeria sp. HKCCD6604]NOD29521.1 invasion associated locus B family protein [Ruegeria atlantica]NOD96120.1 invasion associated locus B family protein [Ruegeria sp. HKCCD6228]
MIKKILSLSTVAAILLCGAGYAQDTTTSEPDNGLDLGQEGPRPGEQFVKEKFGDWDLSCIKAQQGEDPCAIVQILKGNQGDPIAEVSIGRLPEGGAAVAWANVIVPLETLLQAQLALSIDGAPRKLYNYHHCLPVGCVAQLGLSQGDIDAMKAGTKAIFSLVPARFPDQVLEMEMSLSGFTSGYDTLTVNAN